MWKGGVKLCAEGGMRCLNFLSRTQVFNIYNANAKNLIKNRGNVRVKFE